MASASPAIAFGPIPSRRLGRSLGVNHIPPKHCSYNCAYCQVGRTTALDLEPRAFYAVEEVVSAVERRVAECRASGQAVDHVSFVPDGEPTLDAHLGDEIRALKALGVPIAVITNGSLLWRPEVRAALAPADLVSVKVDAVDEGAWRRVCRPPRALDLAAVLDGIRRFAAEYRGRLITDTMLVAGLNDDAAAVEGVARFLEPLRPDTAYLGVPTRPPAESGLRPPDTATVVAAFEILSARLPRVELLTGEDPGGFGRTGDAAQDLLGIISVHPMREEAARRYLEEAGAGGDALEALLASGRAERVLYGGGVFLARRFGPP